MIFFNVIENDKKISSQVSLCLLQILKIIVGKL